MDNKYKNEFEVLKQKIFVGMRQGIKLLEEFNGDVDAAENKFKEDMLALTIEKVQVTSDIAKKHLQKNNYDINAALKSIDEERFTLTELIFRKYKNNKEKALQQIASAIENNQNLQRNFWLDFDSLTGLNDFQYCLMVINEWMNYEVWEGFDSALYFNLDIIAGQIEKQLLLPDIVANLYKAFIRQIKILSRDKLFNVNTDEEFSNCENYFIENKSLLIDALYNYVKNNLKWFP